MIFDSARRRSAGFEARARMAKPDWRSPEAYEPIRDINAAGFAWEFLRRNPDYRADVSRIGIANPPDPDAAGDTARHWGLPFRGRSRSISRRSPRVLASERRPACRPGYACAA